MVDVDSAAGGDSTVTAAHQVSMFAADWMKAASEEKTKLNQIDPKQMGIEKF
jgi:hypothetical protein